jgi:hypothetical protein
MAESSWIKMRCALSTDPAVVEIAAIVALDEFGVVGRLHAVWSWLDQHSENGTNVRISSAFLDRLTACQGFADAMRAVSWISGRDGALNFPGYCKHNGPTAKSRAADTKRKSEIRGRDNRPDDNRTNVPVSTGLEESRVEKKEREGGAASPRSRSVKAMETEPAWLDRLAADHPGVDVRVQLDLARRHRAKEGKPLERAWFEFAWLRNASQEVGGTVRQQAEVEPDRWREIVAEKWPDAPMPERYALLPADVRREVREIARRVVA